MTKGKLKGVITMNTTCMGTLWLQFHDKLLKVYEETAETLKREGKVCLCVFWNISPLGILYHRKVKSQKKTYEKLLFPVTLQF